MMLTATNDTQRKTGTCLSFPFMIEKYMAGIIIFESVRAGIGELSARIVVAIEGVRRNNEKPACRFLRNGVFFYLIAPDIVFNPSISSRYQLGWSTLSPRLLRAVGFFFKPNSPKSYPQKVYLSKQLIFIPVVPSENNQNILNNGLKRSSAIRFGNLWLLVENPER